MPESNKDIAVAFYKAVTESSYYDWLSEYVSVAPRRFGGMALLPNRGPQGAIAEIALRQADTIVIGVIFDHSNGIGRTALVTT